MTTASTTLVILGTLLALTGRPASAATVAEAGDASIAHDSGAGTWTIRAAGASLTLALDPSLDFSVRQLASPSGTPWTIGAMPDTLVTVNRVPALFGSRAAGYVYRNASVASNDQMLRLDAVFDLPTAGLRATRHYAVTSGSPTFEIWTTFAPLGSGRVSLSNLNGVQLLVPAGTMHWLTGLEGDSAGSHHDTAFTLQERRLELGGHLGLGAEGRSSEQTVPWLAVDGASDEFYATLMWSGAWSLSADRVVSGLLLTCGLAPMTTDLGTQPIDGPHVLVGVVRGGLSQASAALRSYILQGVRGGRPMTPLVTYNTWFAYGTSLDEASMRDAMDHAAALGTELFVIDAGWYIGAGAAGAFDFDAGLGTWQPDPVRFPNGLKPLTDYAHGLGMKFGIWVEPERVDLDTVDQPGLVEESWLATSGGHYGSDRTGQVCLVGRAARQWILDRLTSLIDTVQPDYLKWDNNMWVNCDRSGHGHGATDGNFQHVNALYEVLAALRGRYPDLLIENVSGGGNRLDVGMLRYTDVAWMDDRTAPSVNVRHNLQGLSVVFPPAYLLSFVTDHDGEPLHDAPDLSLYFRSRMAGALGLCFRSEGLSPEDVDEMRREIALYKTMRNTLSLSAGALLSAQATVTDGPAWDVFQESAAESGQLLLWAFQGDDGVATITVRPRDLQAQTVYEVRSVDAGVLGTAEGSDLMKDGIDIMTSPTTAAHVLILVAQP